MGEYQCGLVRWTDGFQGASSWSRTSRVGGSLIGYMYISRGMYMVANYKYSGRWSFMFLTKVEFCLYLKMSQFDRDYSKHFTVMRPHSSAQLVLIRRHTELHTSPRVDVVSPVRVKYASRAVCGQSLEKKKIRVCTYVHVDTEWVFYFKTKGRAAESL